MDPARSRKHSKKAQTSNPTPRSFPPNQFPSSNKPSRGRPPFPSAPSTDFPASSSSAPGGHGSFPAPSSVPSSFPRPPRDRPTRNQRRDDKSQRDPNGPPSQPPPPPKQPKPKDASLNLSKQTLTKEMLPTKASHPNLTRLDLTSCEGLGEFGAGWIGNEFGSQLTWLSLNGCEGVEDWDGFELLTGLIVLNVCSCKLSSLPHQFAGLNNLKAFVATGNEFVSLDSDLVGCWKDLNSLILSKNPMLSSLPNSLTTLTQLAKLSVSGCALTTKTLPDLSTLPLLRMFSISHNPTLTALPVHFHTWGTGPLPSLQRPNNVSAESAAARKGDGLEVVELGGCELNTWKSLHGLFAAGIGSMKGLRSLGLKGCGVTKLESYQQRITTLLPSLQILDNTRIVERKAISQPTPAPIPASAPLHPTPSSPPGTYVPPPADDLNTTKRKRKSRATDDNEIPAAFSTSSKNQKPPRTSTPEPEPELEPSAPAAKKRKRSRPGKSAVTAVAASAHARPSTSDVRRSLSPEPAPRSPSPSPPPFPPAHASVAAASEAVSVEAAPPKQGGGKKTDTSVLKVIDVKKGSKKKAKEVDLEELFGPGVSVGGKKNGLKAAEETTSGAGAGESGDGATGEYVDAWAEGGGDGVDGRDAWGVGGWD